MFLLVHREEDYLIYAMISIFAASASNMLNFINARKIIYIKNIGNYDLKRHLKPIFVFFSMACATTIYTNLDIVMLGIIGTDGDVGYYGAATKIKTLLISVVASLGTVLLPRASYYVKNNLLDEFFNIGKKAIDFVILFATPLVIYFMIYARDVIYFLSGEEYTKSILPTNYKYFLIFSL